MWKYHYSDELYHHGIIGMKWGIRKGPPYPIKKVVTNRFKNDKINFRFFAYKASNQKTVILPKKEYAHVMSELATNITNDERKSKVITKHIGKYIYTFENYFNNTFRVIGKKIIK